MSGRPISSPVSSIDEGVSEDVRGWARFAAWAGAGSLAVFAALTGFSIGVFILPFALAALVLAARATRAWPELLGIVEGVAANALLLVLLDDGGTRTAFLVTALVLLPLGLAAYAVATRAAGSGRAAVSLSRVEVAVLAGSMLLGAFALMVLLFASANGGSTG